MITDGGGDKCPRCGKAQMPPWSKDENSCERARMCQNPSCYYVEEKPANKEQIPCNR
jgi:hypothetical protein